MTTTTFDVAAALGHDLCQRIGAGRYDLWFKTTTKFRCEAGQLVVGVPNRFYQEWLQKTFAADVQATAQAVLHEALEVATSSSTRNSFRRPVSAKPARKRSATVRRADAAMGAATPELTIRTRRWRNLDDFVQGSCNRVALAAACHVVEAPGQEANPLVLHGPVGAGKSHLLEGVASGLRKSRPEWRILFVTAEEFTHRFVQAMRLNRIGAFRKQFRSCDALLLDDLQFLAKKQATQEEFLHTLDSLQNEGRPVAAACDCHPRLTDGLLPELVDRLQGGAIWGLTYPDAETREGILRQLSRRPGAAPLPDAVIQMLSTQSCGATSANSKGRPTASGTSPRSRVGPSASNSPRKRWPTCCAIRSASSSWPTWTGPSVRRSACRRARCSRASGPGW